MKKSFTLIELIVVLIIMGILATIATEILLKVYKNYTITKARNALVYKTDLIINEIASKLQSRVPNSVIATECNATNNDCINGNILGFISIQNLTEKNANKYPVIEWLNKDIYSKRGEWNSQLKRVIPGWSGFVDLKRTQINKGDNNYTIIIPDSNMSIVQEIDGNWTERWGISGYRNIFENELSVLIFSGADGRGAFNDINHSYGWYETLYPNNKAEKVFKIYKNSDDNITVTAIDDSNNTTVYEGFFIVNGAEAIVPVYDENYSDYNLTFIQNYYPWKDQNFTDGNSSLLVTHVTEFKFKEQNSLLRIYLCIQDPNVKINNNTYLTICKEKVIF